MASLIVGVVGGFVGAAAMTVVVRLLDGGPLPTAVFLAKFRGGTTYGHSMLGLVLHLLYGTVAGAVLARVLGFVNLDVVGSLPLALVTGLVYGLLVMVVGVFVWLRGVLDVDPDREAIRTSALGHAVFGLVLGAVFAVGPI